MVARGLRILLPPALITAMLALSGLVADRIYNGTLFTVLVAGAAAGSVAISLALTRLRAWSVAPLSMLGLAGYLAFALNLSAQRAGISGDLATIATEALRDGIPGCWPCWCRSSRSPTPSRCRSWRRGWPGSWRWN
ncbi:hypothetical protein ACFQZ4_36475 [Catellatospora coxensis]